MYTFVQLTKAKFSALLMSLHQNVNSFLLRFSSLACKVVNKLHCQKFNSYIQFNIKDFIFYKYIKMLHLHIILLITFELFLCLGSKTLKIVIS